MNRVDDLRAELVKLLDTRKAKTWQNPNWTERYQQQQKQAALGPLEARVRELADQMAQDYQQAHQAARQAATAAMSDPGDTQRALLRELTWQRIAPRIENADSDQLEAFAQHATAVELEAANLHAATLAATSPDMATQERANTMRATLAAAYPASAGAPEAVQQAAKKLAELEPEQAWAEVADGIADGRSFADIGGATWSALLAHESGGRIIYDAMSEDL